MNSAETEFEAIRSEHTEKMLEFHRKQNEALMSLLLQDGRLSAVAIYTDGEMPEGDWVPTGDEVFGKPFLIRRTSSASEQKESAE